MSKPKH